MVGSLEKGKDADLTIWSGDPFSIYTKLEKTIVNGKVYYTN
jgi:imidazolonepropionase-like amidohydrolase